MIAIQEKPNLHLEICLRLASVWMHTARLRVRVWINYVTCEIVFQPLHPDFDALVHAKNHDEAHGLEDLSFLGLPDRNIITVVTKRVLFLDVSYQPIFIGKEACGIHDTSFQSYLKCDVYTCKTISCCRLAQPFYDGPFFFHH